MKIVPDSDYHSIASSYALLWFLFAEKQRPNHIIREMVDFYEVPVYELNRIKNGEDYVTPEGKIVSNSLLTRPSDPPRSYAYCSDTIYMPEIAEQIKGVVYYSMRPLLQMRICLVQRNFSYYCCSGGRDSQGSRSEKNGDRAFLCPL
mgnify:CR=1 FL=1